MIRHLAIKRALIIIALVLLWAALCLFIAQSYFLHRIDEFIRQDTQQSQLRADDLVDSIKRNLNFLSGTADLLARQNQISTALFKFGNAVVPSNIPYETRKAKWNADPGLHVLNQYLAFASGSFNDDLIYVVNAAGECIAASNWNTSGSIVGINFSEREYFRKNKRGDHAMQFSVGKVTHISGFYFASPVLINGKFVGSVVAKVNSSNLSFLIRQTDAFVVDKNGIVILSHDKDKEMHSMSGARVNLMTDHDKNALYLRGDFPELHIGVWDENIPHALLKIDGESLPHLLVSRPLPEYELTVYVEDELSSYPDLVQGRIGFFFSLFLLGGLSGMLIAGALTYVRAIKQSNLRLEESEQRFKTLASGTHEGIVISVHGKILDVNEQFPRILGYERQEIIGQPISKVISRDYLEKVTANISNRVESNSEQELIHKNGSRIFVEAHGQTMLQSGVPVRITAIRDITDSKRVREEVVELNRNLEQIVRERTRDLLAKEELLRESMSLNQNIISASQVGIAAYRHDGQCIMVNPAFAISIGGTEQQLLGQNFHQISSWKISGLLRWAENVLTTGANEDHEMEITTTFGRHRWAQTHLSRFTNHGQPHLLLMIYDITERRILDESMRLAAQIYTSSTEAVMVTDENNFIIDVNPAFTELTGYALEDVRGQNPRILKSGRHDQTFYQEMWHSIHEKGQWQGEMWDRRKDGTHYFKFLSISVIRDQQGRIYRHVAQFFDITDRKNKEELIWRQANFDSLTELPNRHFFRDQLKQELKKSQRTGSELALLFIDLDQFKEVNDTLGHAKGDVLLIEAARRIVGCVRETDTVARLGGDEFTIIVIEYKERSHIERIAQNIIHAMGQQFDLGNGNIVYVSASIGITVYPEDALEIEDLIRNADQAMYAAKQNGRNRFNYFTRIMQIEAQKKLILTNDLRQALARNELEVYYQPIVEMQSGRITKAEALLRWMHPELGMISPAVFVPLAEEAGLIVEIGEWVFLEAIKKVEHWRNHFDRIIQVSVNKSPVQFEKAEQYAWFDYFLSTGLPGDSITVEITEGLLIKDSSKVRKRLLEYHNIGIEVSIDDFGTGFSALSYLKQFDVDYLKIDQSFVRNLTENESDKALVEAIIVMAHKLGIKTIAEGVETIAQRDQLLMFGCDYIQGYLYSRPVSAIEFDQLLTDETRHQPGGITIIPAGQT